MLTLKVAIDRLDLGLTDSVGAVSSVALELSAKVRALVLEPGLSGAVVSVGKVISTSHQSECGVFLQKGARVGAVATVRSAAFAPFIEVKVGPLAKLEHWLVWLSLGLSLVVGLVIASATLPTSMDPAMRFVLGLLGGVVLGVAAIIAITRFGVGREKVGSQQLAVALEALVREWVASKTHGA